MAILTFAIFAGTFAASLWAMFATIAPNARRIVDLLAYGPVAIASRPAPVPARSNLRNVRVRPVTAMGTLPLRAAA